MISLLLILQQGLSFTIPVPTDKPPTFAQISDPEFVVHYREVNESGRLLQAFYAGCLSRSKAPSVDNLEVCFNRTRSAIRDGVLTAKDLRPSSYDLEWALLAPTVDYVRNCLNTREGGE